MTTARTSRKATVGSCYRGIDSSEVEKKGDLFEDKEICIIIEEDVNKKKTLQTSVVEQGGSVAENPSQDTYCIVTSRTTLKIKRYAEKDLYDIVKLEWLKKCLDDRKFYKWKPKDMIHSKLETRNMFSKMYDPYGDSYFEESTVETLKELFKSEQFENKEYKPEMTEEYKMELRERIAFLENKYFPDSSSKFGLFRLHTFYLDFYGSIGENDTKLENKSNLDLLELKIRWHGGVVSGKIDQHITHCILDKK